MKAFAENEEVQKSFIDAALSRPIMPTDTGYTVFAMVIPCMISSLCFLSLPATEESRDRPIELFSSNPRDYRSDVLRKIIPMITNPSGKGNIPPTHINVGL